MMLNREKRPKHVKDVTGVKKKDVMKRENSPKIFPGGDEIEGLFLSLFLLVQFTTFHASFVLKRRLQPSPFCKLIVFVINQAHNLLFEFLRQNKPFLLNLPNL